MAVSLQPLGVLGILPSFSWIPLLPADNDLASPTPRRLVWNLSCPLEVRFSRGNLIMLGAIYLSLLAWDNDTCTAGRMEESRIIPSSSTLLQSVWLSAIERSVMITVF